MKLLCILILSAVSFLKPYERNNEVQKAQYVYICDSKSAYAFHKSTSCSGLNRCKHDILKIKKKEATDMGRSACKICY